jgi:hypothetical protein
MARRLSSRSGGLIEVVDYPGYGLHKTFKDFIRIPENIPVVGDEEANDIEFVGCKSLLRASVYILKYLEPDRRSRHKRISEEVFQYAAQMDTHSFRSAMIPIFG